MCFLLQTTIGRYLNPSHPFVHQQSYLVGIVVPDPEVFVDWSKERGFMGSYKELCQNPVSQTFFHKHPFDLTVSTGLKHRLSQQDVKNAVLEDMRGVGKEAGLKSFEQVSRLFIIE